MPPCQRLIALLLLIAVVASACAPAAAPPASPPTVPANATPTAAATARPASTPPATITPATTMAPRQPTTPPAAVTPTATVAAGPKTTIVDRTTGWPRTIQALNGRVVIKTKPMRVHTLSVGYDEIAFELIGPDRFAAVGQATVNPNYSNVADLAKQVPVKVGRDAEQVIAARPDLVIASPFANQDLVQRLIDAGITVAVTDLVESPEADAANIRLMAYVLGEDEKGEALARTVEQRLAAVERVVRTKPASSRPRVLMLAAQYFTPGRGSLGDAEIRLAGGVNVAAEAGIVGNKQINLEVVPQLKPDVIILTEVDPQKPELLAPILSHPALQEVPAVVNKRVYPVRQAYFNTLSHWNVTGVETLAKILYPDDFR